MGKKDRFKSSSFSPDFGNEGDDALLPLVPIGGCEMGALVELNRAS